MTKAIKARHQNVSTVELFFDLVFVFMVTQLTHLVEHAHGWADFVMAASILTLLWWLYSGWLWLVSTLGVGLQLRVVLIVSMAGFLAMATALPRIGADGIKLFALAYLAVVLLHSASFVLFGGAAHVKAIAIMAPFNFGAAAFVLGAAWMDASWRMPLLAVGAIGLLAASVLPRPHGFSLQAGHFSERHGLVILIAFGEAIIAIGSSAKDLPFDSRLSGVCALGMMLIVGLWWRYFSGDDEEARHSLEAASTAHREQLGAVYWQTHLVLIAGVVLISAGIKSTVAQTGTDMEAGVLLGLGTALFLVGHGIFRVRLGLGRDSLAVWAGIVALLCIPLAIVAGRIMGLGALVLMLFSLIAADIWTTESRRASSTLGHKKPR
jgi:low temperature requirement protein LtrA